MKSEYPLRDMGRRILRSLLSVPIYAKILGIGFLVAAIFGGVTLYQIHYGVSSLLYSLMEKETTALAEVLAHDLERPLITGDLYSARQKLLQMREIDANLRYAIVRSSDGDILVHTFEGPVPVDLARVEPEIGNQVLASDEGLIFTATTPVLNGRAGVIHLGVSDQEVNHQLDSISTALLYALGFCMILGQGLALGLTHVLTRPIHHLLQVTKRIREKDFAARADVLAEDETGQLSRAFNEMAEALELYRDDVQRKEEARKALLDRIVTAQEAERKSLARELHDQLGQSLSNTLMTMDTHCTDCTARRQGCGKLRESLCQHIDEVRHLAWNMRPSILDDYGLDSALGRYLEDRSVQVGLTIDYECDWPKDEERLANRIEVGLYRIAQEAITNVVLHASANRASVVLMRQKDSVVLVIEDDGHGFDAASLGQNIRSLGIMGMRERAALLGGEFMVDSFPGAGTTVRVRVPLEDDA